MNRWSNPKLSILKQISKQLNNNQFSKKLHQSSSKNQSSSDLYEPTEQDYYEKGTLLEDLHKELKSKSIE